MEYAILIYRDESKDGDVDWPRREAEYEAYFKSAAGAGVMRGGPRLARSTATKTVVVRNDDRQITDGPFLQSADQLGGIFVVDCAGPDEALEWAARCPGASHGTVEVRPVAPS